MSPARRRAVLVALFFASGVVAIQYEVLWLRVFTHLVGTGVRSVSAVVTAFLLGLALGGALLGRRADRAGSALRLYGLLEIGTGALHLAAFGLFRGFDPVYAALWQWLPWPVLRWLVFGLAVLFVTLPATLIGGTVPVLLKHFALEDEEAATRSAAKLYALNTLGAGLGALVLAHGLLPRLGYPGALVAASLASAALGLAALALARAPLVPGAPPPGQGAHPEERGAFPIPGWLVLGAYAASGFASLGYEVVWSRLLEFVFKGTLQSFAHLLVLFLVGLASGNLLAIAADRTRVDRRVLFGLFSLGAGLLAAGSLVLTWRDGIEVSLVLSILGITTLVGATFPIAVRLRHRGVPFFGRVVGSVYSWNTAGSIAGSFATGFVLIPLLGSQGTLLALAGLHVVAGCAVLASARPRAALGAALAGGGAIAACVVLVPGDALRTVGYRAPGHRVIFSTENELEILAVTEGEHGERTLFGGPYASGSTSRRSVQLVQGHLALLLHPRPRRVLEIGYGVGEILRCIERHSPEEVDLVEIDPGMIPVADAWFELLNRGSSRAPNVTTRILDGRHWLAMTDRTYDVVMSDAFFLVSEAATRLYTLEHFQNAARHLNPGGLAIAWVPLNMGDRRVAIVVETFRSAFPEAIGWRESSSLFLVGALSRPALDLALLRARFEVAREDLRLVALEDFEGFLGGFRLGPAELAAIGEGAPVHRDLRPTLDFAPVGGTDRGSRLNVELARGSPRSLLPWLGGSAPGELATLERLAALHAPADRVYQEVRAGLSPGGDWDLRLGAVAPALAEEGVARLESALVLFPAHAEARALSADLCLKLGLEAFDRRAPARGEAWLERALVRAPLAQSPNYVLATRWLAKGQGERARPYLERYRLAQPYGSPGTR